MARKKHPEETVNLILDVAERLFVEKGYEHTSIQDIIEQLGGLSKGAIYHHFKSKEEILYAVSEQMSQGNVQLFQEVRDNPNLRADEKLKLLFKASLRQQDQDGMFAAAPNLNKNPQLLFSILHDTVDEVAPAYILPIIQQGVDDGSIQTAYPKELSEIILLIANVWLNPMIFDSSVEESYRKFMVFRQMMQGFHLDIADDEILERLMELVTLYQKNR